MGWPFHIETSNKLIYRDAYTPQAAAIITSALLAQGVAFQFSVMSESIFRFAVQRRNRLDLEALIEAHVEEPEITNIVLCITQLEANYVLNCVWDTLPPDPGYYEEGSGAYLGETIQEAAAYLGCYSRNVEVKGMFDQ